MEIEQRSQKLLALLEENAGDYYIPDLKLPEENRTMGRYGRLYREYLKQEYPAQYSALILTEKSWTYLADLNDFDLLNDSEGIGLPT